MSLDFEVDITRSDLRILPEASNVMPVLHVAISTNCENLKAVFENHQLMSYPTYTFPPRKIAQKIAVYLYFKLY